jgi:lactoylglutathione lyase
VSNELFADSSAADAFRAFDAIALSPSLTAMDVRKSVAWYRDVLGFAVTREYERDGRLIAVALKAGAVEILITQDDGARGSDRIKGDGISLRLTTAQNVDELASRVKACGGVLDSEPADAWGARVFRLRDPDGFKLVISSQR